METMSRRTFGAAVAAVFGTAAAGRLPSQPQVDLSPFAARNAFARYDLRRPFSQGSHAYATDARIICRTHDEPGDDGGRKFPNVRELPWDAFSQTRWLPYPDARYVDDGGGAWSRCVECKGEGRLGAVKCDCVEGLQFADGEFAPCLRCEGTGLAGGVTCGNCNYGYNSLVFQIGGIAISPDYDTRIRTLPGVRYAVANLGVGVPAANGAYDPRALLFSGDGFQGICMPLVRKT